MRARSAAVALAIGAAALTAACGEDDGDLMAFCDADERINSTDPFGSDDAEEAERRTNDMRAALAAGRDAAPEDIEKDATRVSRVFEGMLDELEAAGYDTSKVDPGEASAEAAAADPEFEPALGRLAAYTAENCT